MDSIFTQRREIFFLATKISPPLPQKMPHKRNDENKYYFNADCRRFTYVFFCTLYKVCTCKHLLCYILQNHMYSYVCN